MGSEQTLNIRIIGSGEPALVFVHGFGCSLDDWDAQVEALSQQFKCVTLDLPGHGGSSKPGSVTIEALAAAVNVAKARSEASKVVLIGHSLGTKVIREAYCQSREHVVGLILVDGSMYPGDAEVLLQRARESFARAGFDAFVGGMFADMFVAGTDPAIRERVTARALALDPEFGRQLFLASVGWDPVHGERTLREIDVPLLLLQSTFFGASFKREPLQPGLTTPFMDRIRDLVRKSDVRVVTGAGHFPMLDMPDVVNRHIREFAMRC
jgi:pimeloyl-ACP methyl ester carboxylesterase